MLRSSLLIKRPWRWWLIFAWGVFVVPSASVAQSQRPPGTFMVIDRGTALLGPDGQEIVRFSSKNHAAGALSPDGQWAVFVDSSTIDHGDTHTTRVIIQSQRDPADRTSIPMIWGKSGSRFQPLWSPDSQRVLICEQGRRKQGRTSAYRVYDLATKNLVDWTLSLDQIPTEWSANGKCLLSTVDGRIAWINIEGTDEPEFLTSKFEVAFGARSSPDGLRLLCMAGFRSPNAERQMVRLSVVEVESKKRTLVDEPGETYGYCWSPDGSRIAYTWRRTTKDSDDTSVREIYLITCDVDGGDRKVVTSRKYDVPKEDSGGGGTFEVLSWR